jgi:hypothetical protein
MLGDEALFAAVDAQLTPGMAMLGYHRIGGSRNEEPASRGQLVAESSGDGVERPSPEPFLVFDFGFEAGSDEARRLVDADDPDTADELWLSYNPATGELDLGAWDFVSDHAVWTPRTDIGPCFGAAVEARLKELGRAVIEFAQTRPR